MIKKNFFIIQKFTGKEGLSFFATGFICGSAALLVFAGFFAALLACAAGFRAVFTIVFAAGFVGGHAAVFVFARFFAALFIVAAGFRIAFCSAFAVVLAAAVQVIVSGIIGFYFLGVVTNSRNGLLNFERIGFRCCIFYRKLFGIFTPRSIRSACCFSGFFNFGFAHTAVTPYFDGCFFTGLRKESRKRKEGK
jgi:hypothetical protein